MKLSDVDLGDSLPLDPGIEPYVVRLWEQGVETFESCEGGTGHAAPEPMVRFHGGVGEGHRVLGIALVIGLPVSELVREWPVIDNEPTGPYWRMTFRQKATERTVRSEDSKD